MINRDGSARVRPGLRYLSISDFGVALTEQIVGTHEAFFLNDGSKAYLFAVKEADGTVGFRVLKTGASPLVCQLDDPGIDFALPAVPTTLRFSAATTYVKYLQIDNKIFALSNAGEPMRMFFVGSAKSAKPLASITRPGWNVADKLDVMLPAATWVSGAKDLPPTPQARAADTLISSTRKDNVFSFSFFYTFSNEVGESAASKVTSVHTQRPWSGWVWETPDAATGEPSGTETNDPDLSGDQLVAVIPQAAWDAAIAQGATGWSLYMFTWSDQDPVPVTAIKVGIQDARRRPRTAPATGWMAVTPSMSEVGSEIAVLPTKANRYNFSNPSRGGQGLVAADRMIMVYDPTAAAVIRWSSNQQGYYTDFTAAKGGGYKTLTSGNLYVPACVKLWQNPQSVDTLTILCMGVDGYSTGYYMAPSQVASQSEATNIMGFEETTATPGTTSPYGVEVFNNALYHPLDDQLMKSTRDELQHQPRAADRPGQGRVGAAGRQGAHRLLPARQPALLHRAQPRRRGARGGLLGQRGVGARRRGQGRDLVAVADPGAQPAQDRERRPDLHVRGPTGRDLLPRPRLRPRRPCRCRRGHHPPADRLEAGDQHPGREPGARRLGRTCSS